MSEVTIRAYQPGDLDEVISIFNQAVLGTANQFYTLEQCQAWQSGVSDRTQFGFRLQRGMTLIGECQGQLAAFGQLHPANHINLLYCIPEFSGRGIASAILQRLEAMAQALDVTEILTEASLSARSYFEHRSYQIIAIEIVTRQGIDLQRVRMKKRLTREH
jgi:putative acetyltransferase